MINKLEQLHALDGQTIYFKHSWVGWSPLKVSLADNDSVILSGENTVMNLSGIPEEILEEWLERSPLFKSLDDAKQYDQDVSDNRINGYLDNMSKIIDDILARHTEL